jgi:hypothetical protein
LPVVPLVIDLARGDLIFFPAKGFCFDAGGLDFLGSDFLLCFDLANLPDGLAFFVRCLVLLERLTDFPRLFPDTILPFNKGRITAPNFIL